MKIIAKALVYDLDNNILILRRSMTHPNMPHHSDLPGGEADGNENATKAVTREIFEETGLIISDTSVQLVHEKKISEEVNHSVYIAKVDMSKPTVKVSWEHDAYTWKTLKEIREETLPKNVDIYYLTVLEYLSMLN